MNQQLDLGSARRRIALLALVIGLGATGCVTRLQSIPNDFQAGGERRTVVIGRVEVLRDTGEPYWKVPPSFMAFGEQMKLRAKNEDSGRIYVLTAAEPGAASDFYVAAPPGRYRVMEVLVRNLHATVPVTFDVPDAPTVYVGTLRFSGRDASFGARLLGTMASGRWSVEDTQDAVMERFRARYPRLTEPVVPSLMRLVVASR